MKIFESLVFSFAGKVTEFLADLEEVKSDGDEAKGAKYVQLASHGRLYFISKCCACHWRTRKTWAPFQIRTRLGKVLQPSVKHKNLIQIS